MVEALRPAPPTCDHITQSTGTICRDFPRMSISLPGSVAMKAIPLALGVVLLATACHGGSTRGSQPTTAPRRPVSSHRRGSAHPGLPTSAQQARALSRLVRLGYPIYCGGRRKPVVALTFDDGPGPYTPIALRMLRRAHARATFFLVGKVLRRFSWMPRKEAELAALGDHTWTHSYGPGLSPSAIRSELARTKRAVTQLAHAPVLLYRPPYGARSPAATSAARRLGLVEVLWSTDSADSAGAVPRQILANVTAGLHPGAIILMHENRGQTLKALKAILRRAKRRHLRTVTVPELLTMDPPSYAQLRRGPGGCGAHLTAGSGG